MTAMGWWRGRKKRSDADDLLRQIREQRARLELAEAEIRRLAVEQETRPNPDARVRDAAPHPES